MDKYKEIEAKPEHVQEMYAQIDELEDLRDEHQQNRDGHLAEVWDARHRVATF